MYRYWLAVCLAVAAFAQGYSANRDEQLAAYIEEALDNNPIIGQRVAEYRAALQKIPQATGMPDPMLRVGQVLRSPEARSTSLALEQTLPWFGKLDEQGKVAAKEASWRAEMVEAARADVVREVKLAYYDLAYVDAAIEVTGEELDLLGHFESLAQAQYSQGAGLQQAVIKLQTEITRGQNRIEQLRALRVDAESALNRTMDRPAATTLPTIRAVERPRTEMDIEALYEAANRQSPEMKAAFFQIEEQEKRIDLARKQYWPDFTVGVGFTNMLGRPNPSGGMGGIDKNMWDVMVGVNLPIGRRKRDAAVLEATESLIAAKQSYHGNWNRLEAALRATAFRLETTEDQISLFEGTLLPQAEQSLRASEAAYSTGEVGVLELLDSQRVLLDVRLGLAQMTSEYMKALAEMERTVGGAFPEVIKQ